MTDKTKKIVSLIILLIIIVGFIGYKLYERFQIIECSTVKNCKTCTKSFGCLWCKRSNKCVSDLSNSILCPRESTAADPFGCDLDVAEDVSGSQLNSPLFGGKCSANKDCTSCLRSPDCFWCNNSQQCAGSVELYARCKDDINIYNSTAQCAASKVDIPESTVPFDPKDTVIPVQGLSRNTDGSLTNSSFQIIFNSLNIEDEPSMNRALNRITKEMDFYKNQYKTNINTYVNNTIDYVNDPKSLDSAKNTNQRLQDLRDISRYVNDYGNSFLNQRRRPEFNSKDTAQQILDQGDYFEFFKADTYKEKDEFNYTLQKNKSVLGSLELFWLGNIIALGTLYYFMKL
jgi:hypothetical protein